MSQKFDFIIVGAGSAGCVLANRLTASGKFSVLLVEAGAKDISPWLHIPIGYAKTYYNPAVNWMYYTAADAGINNRQSYWPRGKVLGGSSAINAMVFIRGQHEDFNDWEKMGATGWGWEGVLPYFKRLEDAGFTDHPLRGSGGAVTVSETTHGVHHTSYHFLKGCEQLGFTLNADFNAETQEGVNLYQANIRGGIRISSSRAYLKPARARKNLTVLTEAHAVKLNVVKPDAVKPAAVKPAAVKSEREKPVCNGIVCMQKGKEIHFTALKEVILSAGAIGSPQLLQCSGIGDAELLKRLGIAVKHHSPMVGENLTDHLGFNDYYKSNLPTLNDQFNSYAGCIRAGLQYIFTRKGPFSVGVNHAGGFVKSSDDRPRPNIQLYFQPTSFINAPKGTRPAIRLDNFSGLSMGISQCRPSSRGSVKIAHADCRVAPTIQPNYLSTQNDCEEMVEGLKIIRQIAQTPAMRSIIKEQINKSSDDSDAALLEDFRRHADTVFHPTCTCAMGDDPAKNVVDSRLKVYGIERLRVADASVFPTITSGNTNAPSMMVGEKASDLILHDHQ